MISSVELAQTRPLFRVLLLKGFVYYIVAIETEEEPSEAELPLVYLHDLELNVNKKGKIESSYIDFKSCMDRLKPSSVSYTRVSSGKPSEDFSSSYSGKTFETRILNRKVTFTFENGTQLVFGMYGRDRRCVSSEYLWFENVFVGAHCGTLPYCLNCELDKSGGDLEILTFSKNEVFL
uniref:20 kDa protein n=1 Tax=Beet yellows virus TaxID=12161 RepID=A0A8F2JGI9_9CLOS|nr:20 kDa protein [Beet yellows virus]